MSESIAIIDVIDVVCEHFQCSQVDLRSQRRTARIVEPRQIAMYLANKLTERSLPQIGKALGDRDHTTVLHAREKVASKIKGDPKFAATVDALELAASTLGNLRGRGLLQNAEEPITPRELAQRILAGGRRAAMRVSPDHVLELADALLAAFEDKAADQEETPIFVEAPPPTLSELVHGFLGKEASYRRSPSVSMRAGRDRALDALRKRPGENARVDAVVAAFDVFARCEYTAGEYDAHDRYQAAVCKLAKDFSKMEIAANG